MQRKFIIFFVGLFFGCGRPSFAQLEADHWMFGRNNYVYFNHGYNPDTLDYPYPLSAVFNKGSCSYSDKKGNLLFYWGGFGQIFDKNFQVFPSLDIYSGVPLKSVNYLSDVTQTVLGIPYPGHDSLYIIFHIWSDFSNQYYSPLYYSVVNMNLRGGLGEIEPSQKNIPLLNGVDVAFKLTAVLHCNKKDIWVIGHYLDSDQYFSLLVTQNGISATPFTFPGQFIPRVYFNNSDHPNNKGCVKVSALGNRLAAAFHGMNFIELFDFNNQTGMGSNLKTITAHPPDQDTLYNPTHFSNYGPIGVDFSPTGNKLYISSDYELRNSVGGYGYAAYLYQFDASLNSSALIQNTQYRIDSLNGNLGGSIQIGNNGRMYVDVTDNLYEIADPENAGAACNYRGLTVYSGQGIPNLSLPVYLQSYFRYPVIATGNCQFSNISFSVQNPVGISGMIWNFGDPPSGVNNTSSSFTPTHIFSQEGTYEVSAVLINSNGCGADTVRKIVHAGPFKVDLGNDTTICRGDTLKLSMNIPNGNNLWNTGSRDTTISITQSGAYWIRVNIGECVASDTINVIVREPPSFTLGTDTTICSNVPLTLYPFPSFSNVSYLWSNGLMTPNIIVSSAGSYWLTVTDAGYGCSYTDTVNVAEHVLPDFSLGSDTALCQGQSLRLNASASGASNYLWNTGANTASIIINQPGLYWVDVTKDQCIYRDSIAIQFKPLPIINIGNDTTVCEGETIMLDAGNAGAQYLWQDSKISETYPVTTDGSYSVMVTVNGCSSADTINVQYSPKPVFTLGKDTVICDGMSIVLRPLIQNNNGVAWLWSSGSTDSMLVVTQPGEYILTGTNSCGSNSHVINISKGVCTIYIPTAFTPNNDGLNDVFKASFGENVKDFTLEVYNRWGQKVFVSKDIKIGWDGKMNGIMQPGGVYVWVLHYKNVNDIKDTMLKGTVLLIR